MIFVYAIGFGIRISTTCNQVSVILFLCFFPIFAWAAAVSLAGMNDYTKLVSKVYSLIACRPLVG
jgi:hypothetical protein